MYPWRIYDENDLTAEGHKSEISGFIFQAYIGIGLRNKFGQLEVFTDILMLKKTIKV